MKWSQNILLLLIVMGVICNSCVDQIDFPIPEGSSQIIIEGLITDGPPPYLVKVSRGINLNADSLSNTGYSGLEVTLHENESGKEETLTEVRPGEYESTGVIVGTVGYSYYITVTTPEGTTITSEPDILHPVGEIDSIKIEFESRTKVLDFAEVRADVFNVLVDSEAKTTNDSFVRWRFQGTYKVVTDPQEFMIQFPWSDNPLRRPFECSGYIVVANGTPLGGVESIRPCECCTCWVNDYEPYPELSDGELVTNNQFFNVKVGEVSISSSAFFDKYRIRVEQMSMSRNAFDFFNLVRAQKIGATDFFQPPSGEILGNLTASDQTVVVGIFWASAVRTKDRFLYKSDVPYPIGDIPFAPKPCYDVYDNATTIEPEGWNQ